MQELTVSFFQALPALCAAVATLIAARRSAHYFQLESYQFAGYFKTLSRQIKRVYAPLTLLFVLILALLAGYGALCRALNIHIIAKKNILPLALLSGGFSIIVALCGVLISRRSRGAEKKPFVITPRVKRLCTMLLAVLLLSAWGLYAATPLLPAILPLLLPLFVALAGVLVLPVEKGIQRMYLNDAKKKLLSNDRLIRIGVTGSYGKTSTKFVLATLLQQKYNVLFTPASFNTPMGLTRIIRERLTPSHQVFIGEMGARHVGDIKELCDLVHPTIGVLTSVGPQHLDTFGTLERITNTKYDLIRALPEDGLAVFLNDDAIVTQLYEKTAIHKLLAGKQGADAWAEDVRLTSQGSAFTLMLKGCDPLPVTTRLLGRHNINNILVASALSLRLGLTPRQIAAGIAQLEPVEHRMQIVSAVGEVTVIDDAFNTNPRSSKEALEVLKGFEGRRIIVTPGMVELGAEEEKYNEEFGAAMAQCVDMAVLVGKKHAAPIKKGLLLAGFDEQRIFLYDTLEEAVAMLNGIRAAGDVILYENDLPDNYSEN